MKRITNAIRLLCGEVLLDVWVNEPPLNEHTLLRATVAGRFREGWRIVVWGGEYLVGFDEPRGELLGFSTDRHKYPWLKHWAWAQSACHRAFESRRPFTRGGT